MRMSRNNNEDTNFKSTKRNFLINLIFYILRPISDKKKPYTYTNEGNISIVADLPVEKEKRGKGIFLLKKEICCLYRYLYF